MSPPEPPTGVAGVEPRGTVVGSAAGPAEGAGALEIVLADGATVRPGTFVVYETSVMGEPRTVLARIAATDREGGVPGAVLADPDADPDRLLDALGLEGATATIDRATVEPIGYYDREMGTFRNPRSLPDPGTPVARATDDYLEAVLPNVAWGETATAHVGWLLDRPAEAANCFLPVDRIAATHLAVLAATGSGKSYTASVVVEELLRPAARAAVLIFDPHGEYDTLQNVRRDAHSDIFADGAYRPEVRVIDPDDISIAIPDLTYPDLVALLDDPSERMRHVLQVAWRTCRGDAQIQVEDIVRAAYAADGEDSDTAAALEWRLHRSLGRDLFTAAARHDVTDLVAPGQATVLQIDRLSRDDQQMLAAALLRKLYRAREAAMRDADDRLDFPLFTLLEEGHRFAPDGQARSLPIVRQILSEGRKFGFGVGIVSQRPSKLDADVLSQCGTQIIMQITNPTDQQAIREAVESAGASVLDHLPGLTPGQAVLAGDAMNTPVLARIRERHTPHGAESPDASAAWTDAWSRTRDRSTTDAYETDDVEDTPL